MPMLDDGETTVLTIPGKYNRTTGIVTVTNRRLLFTYSTGVVNRRDFTLLNVSLLAIQDAQSEQRFAGSRLVLTVRGEGYSGVPRVELALTDPHGVAQAIRTQASTLKHRLAQAAAAAQDRSSAPVSVTINQAPSPLPPPQVMLRCQYCRTVYPETAAKCPMCGAVF
jgi:hypothetical protein